MKRHRTVIGSPALAGLVTLPAAAARADGGRGNSYCSSSEGPTGEFAGNVADDQTYGNAGEVISWFSQQGLEPTGPWGQTVKTLCDPSPS